MTKCLFYKTAAPFPKNITFGVLQILLLNVYIFSFCRRKHSQKCNVHFIDKLFSYTVTIFFTGKNSIEFKSLSLEAGRAASSLGGQCALSALPTLYSILLDEGIKICLLF